MNTWSVLVAYRLRRMLHNRNVSSSILVADLCWMSFPVSVLPRFLSPLDCHSNKGTKYGQKHIYSPSAFSFMQSAVNLLFLVWVTTTLKLCISCGSQEHKSGVGFSHFDEVILLQSAASVQNYKKHTNLIQMFPLTKHIEEGMQKMKTGDIFLSTLPSRGLQMYFYTGNIGIYYGD